MTVQAPAPGGAPEQPGQSQAALAAARQAANTTVAAGAASTASNTLPRTHQTTPIVSTPYSQRSSLNKGSGVGGTPVFSLTERTVFGGKAGNKFVFEMAPARKSHMSGQGQIIPNAYAGMPISMVFNLAKIPMPGAQSSFQGMGIAYEVLDIAGAFVSLDNPFSVTDTGVGRRDAATAAEELFRFKQTGREVVLHLGWKSSNGIHNVEFDSNIEYTGRLRRIERSFAHENRVYYNFRLEITNREDTSASAKKINDTAAEQWYGTTVEINANTTRQWASGNPETLDEPNFNAITGVDSGRVQSLVAAYAVINESEISAENSANYIAAYKLIMDPANRRSQGFTAAENDVLAQDGNFRVVLSRGQQRKPAVERVVSGSEPGGTRPR